MKKLASAIAAVALIGTPAFAADMARKMPVKAPPPVPAPVYSWTGWYVGGNVGYSWGKSNNTWNVFAPNLGTPTCGLSLCVTGNDSNHLNGAIGGIEIGYNWQVANYLFGVETDIQLSGQKGSQTFNGSTGPIPLTTVAAVPMTAAYTEKLPWFGTLRGRIGVVSDRPFLRHRRARLWCGENERLCHDFWDQHTRAATDLQRHVNLSTCQLE